MASRTNSAASAKKKSSSSLSLRNLASKVTNKASSVRSSVRERVDAALQSRPHSAQVSASLLGASLLWLIAARANNRRPLALASTAVLPPLSAALAQGVALVGALDLHSAVRAQLGVTAALGRGFIAASALGHALGTLAHVPLLTSAVGRVFFAFNALLLAVHAHMAYLTLAYNWRLERRRRPRVNLFRPRVNLAALAAWAALQGAVLLVWLQEGRKALLARRSTSESLAALGFLLQSLASVRAGLDASLASQAQLPSLNGALSIAASQLLSALALLPLLSASSPATSALARVMLAGYASTLYTALLNAYYAYRLERDRERARVPTAVYRLRPYAKL